MRCVQPLERSILSIANAIRWSGGKITVQGIKETFLVGYLTSALLYYWNIVPFGPLLNGMLMGFLILITAAEWRSSLAIRNEWNVAFALSCGAAFCAVCTAIARDASVEHIVKASYWAIIPLFITTYLGASPINIRRVCRWVFWFSIMGNLALTFGLSSFNAASAKFEYVSTDIDISSNELSFHLVMFVLLFYAAYGRGTVQKGLWLLPFIHLSKAHLFAYVGSGLIARSASNVVRVALLFLVGFVVLYLVVNYEPFFSALIPEGYLPVFGRMRDLALIAGQLAIYGLVLDGGMLTAVGLDRFEIYSACMQMLMENPLLGYEGDHIKRALDGYDPHSNAFYVALNYGVPTLVLYASLFFALFHRSADMMRGAKRTFRFFLFYAFIRTLFMTYDPVRLFIVLLILLDALGLKKQ